jgi:dipeptidyl aminopeptidase/acylaminoacyl peptidase
MMLLVGALLVLAVVGTAAADNSGSRLAFRRFPSDGIFVMNPYDPGSITLFTAGSGFFRPTLSPLGDRLVMFRDTGPGDELVLFDYFGNELETLATDLGFSYLDWSPDGKEIAYSYSEQTAGETTTGFNDDVYVSTIRAIDVETRVSRIVTTVGTFGPDRVGISIGGLQISWSGDGSEIAYTRRTSYSCGADLDIICSDQDIMVVDAQGGTGVALTSDGHSEGPDFSPDGQTIVFRQENNDGFGGIFLLPRSGGAATLLVGKDDLAGSRFQRFSPDGE